MFGVTILGNNSALPAYERHPTSQVVTLDEHLFLIDCGEGTQMQLSRYKIRRGRINHIFISHLHGDHYFGLPGLLTTLGLMNRENDLHLYAPAQLKQILDLQFSISDTKLPFELYFHSLETEGVIVDDVKFSVECFRVYHRIECFGFIVREKNKPRKTLNKTSSPPLGDGGIQNIESWQTYDFKETLVLRRTLMRAKLLVQSAFCTTRV